VRRGCISLGNVQCDDCHRTIPYPERYLIEETEDVTLHLCVDCCQNRGYVHYESEKGKSELTFLVE